ncbi:hypothetical protein NEAUS05_2656, partial [Nematocida ausubeli]
SASASMKYITSFCDLVKNKTEEAAFSFWKESTLPIAVKVPQYKQDLSGFEEDRTLDYINHTETALFGLFCCLAYNPEKKEYETSHMGEEVSPAVTAFFKKYPKPTDTITLEMHMEWSKVVSCLDNKKIQYRHNRNQLESGLANILLVIAEITGQKTGTDIVDLVEYIEERCRENNLDICKIHDIASKIKEVFRSLASPKLGILVMDWGMKLGHRPDESADILGGIHIVSTHNYKNSTFILQLKRDYATFNFIEGSGIDSSNTNQYEEVRRMYTDTCSYIMYTVNRYIDLEIEDTSFMAQRHSWRYPIERTDAILSAGYENVSKLFLIGKISNKECKIHIVEQFILHLIENELSPINPATRFVANVLGSAPLDKQYMRGRMLSPLLFLSSCQTHYPKLSYLLFNNILVQDSYRLNIDSMYGCILKKKSIGFAVKCIENY